MLHRHSQKLFSIQKVFHVAAVQQSWYVDSNVYGLGYAWTSRVENIELA